MRTLKQIIDNNRAWVDKVLEEDPEFFNKLSNQQAPDILWIGCSDSRVPANQITGLLPGEVFVHRNVANMVVHTDFNCLSVMQFAIEVLKVKHVIVCGHYGCGGVMAAFSEKRLGLIDNWIRHIRDVKYKHRRILKMIEEEQDKFDALCELNVIEQVMNVCNTSIVHESWEAGAKLSVHGWIYDVADGYLKDLDICVTESSEIINLYRNAVERVRPEEI